MRKTDFFIALAATCALSLNAQTSESLISEIKFSVEDQTKVKNPNWVQGEDPADEEYLPNTYSIPMNSEINMEFVGDKDNDLTQTLGFTPYLMLTTGGGFAIDGTFYSLASSQDGNNPSLYAFPLNKEKWGNPYMGAYNVTPMVCFLKSTGEKLPNEFTQQELAEDDELAMRIEFYMVDDEPVFFQAPSYTTPNTFSAELLGVYPDNKWEDETFAQAYQRDECLFSFSNTVNFTNNARAVLLVYTLAEGGTVRKYLSYNPDEEGAQPVTLGWNQLDGNYTVSVNFKNEDYTAEQLSSIQVTLMNVVSEGESLGNLTLEMTNTNPLRAKKQSQTGIASEILTSNEALTVYNLQGMVVAENISVNELNRLAPGMYVVNGKKIVVR